MHRNKTRILVPLIGFISLGIAATRAPHADDRNLQVLPADISEQKLDSIMKSYNRALGVGCGFCHVPFDKKFPDSLDFVSDAEPMKEQARRMMRMNIALNQTYFYFDRNERPEYLRTVTCYTCHRGDAFPEQ